MVGAGTIIADNPRLTARIEGAINPIRIIVDGNLSIPTTARVFKEKGRNNLTISRTDLVKKEELDYFNSINVGDIVDGKVKEVLDFGVILELGPTTGFIHISEVSWDQVSDLIEKFGINDIVKAKIIEKDDEKRKIKLSLKQLEVDPWIEFKNTHTVGDTVKGTVKEVLDFGLVVEISRNKGFVHISELAWNNAAKVLKQYKEGDIIEAKIISIDDEKSKTGLILSQDITSIYDVPEEGKELVDLVNVIEHTGTGGTYETVGFDDEHLSELESEEFRDSKSVELRKKALEKFGEL